MKIKLIIPVSRKIFKNISKAPPLTKYYPLLLDIPSHGTGQCQRRGHSECLNSLRGCHRSAALTRRWQNHLPRLRLLVLWLVVGRWRRQLVRPRVSVTRFQTTARACVCLCFVLLLWLTIGAHRQSRIRQRECNRGEDDQNTIQTESPKRAGKWRGAFNLILFIT